MWNQDLCAQAYAFAVKAYREQKAERYIFHISLTAMEIMKALTVEKTADPTLAVQCALLHDVLEDTESAYDDLVKSFGRRVADGVMAVSKNKALPSDLRMADSLERIRLQPLEIWMVKLADRIVNLGPPPPNWDRAKKLDYRTEALLIHSSLSEASAYLGGRLLEKIHSYPIES